MEDSSASDSTTLAFRALDETEIDGKATDFSFF
jgi:hypothetical protein